MKKTQLFLLTCSILSFTAVKSFAKESSPYGIVSFDLCITESKYGKQEQESLEKLKNQMATLMGDLEKQLTEIATKFQDADFVDSLSPEAEQEMKSRYQTLGEELNRYQNQYIQLMQQANMKLVQTMNDHVTKASERIAKKKKIPMVMREEACFHYQPELDITTEVVAEMDKTFDLHTQHTPQTESTQK